MGKQHGSLTRAGKVKKQTPVVAKKEDRKKPPVGRAKKRLLYNKRYLNAPQGPNARRKGPNSHSK